MSEASEADKEHDPTPQRLQEARDRGEVASSPDLTAAAGLGGLILALAAFGPGAVERLGNAGMQVLAAPEAQGRAELAGFAADSLLAALPFFLVPAAAALLALVAQQALVVSSDRLEPKLSRISPLAAAKQKFGAEGLTDFIKATVKLILVAGVLFAFLAAQGPEILGAHLLSPGLVAARIGSLILGFLAIALALALALGGIDFLIQRFRHIRRLRMTRQELIDEMKRSEGDPHLKHERRLRGREIALDRMLADVPRADVVVVNPTHYAVALRWDRASGRAPVCLAKGTDGLAARIRERAAEAGVPIHRDPPTARALYASLEVGNEVRPDHYRAVAAAIRFAEAMRRRARGLAAT